MEFSGLDKAFGEEPKGDLKKHVDKVKPLLKKSQEDDVRHDYETARAQMHNLVSKGQEAVDGILEGAQSSDHPRAYEVVGQIMRQLAETNKDLIDLQKDMKKIKDEDSTKKVTQNAIFMGSTAELQKFLRGQGHVSQKIKDITEKDE